MNLGLYLLYSVLGLKVLSIVHFKPGYPQNLKLKQNIHRALSCLWLFLFFCILGSSEPTLGRAMLGGKTELEPVTALNRWCNPLKMLVGGFQNA